MFDIELLAAVCDVVVSLASVFGGGVSEVEELEVEEELGDEGELGLGCCGTENIGPKIKGAATGIEEDGVQSREV